MLLSYYHNYFLYLPLFFLLFFLLIITIIKRLEMEGNLTLLFVVLLNYLKIFSLLVWLFWIIVTILRARSRLDRLPYITYRFRQLPFRFFIIQGFLCCREKLLCNSNNDNNNRLVRIDIPYSHCFL
jgi:hypothetical protein